MKGIAATRVVDGEFIEHGIDQSSAPQEEAVAGVDVAPPGHFEVGTVGDDDRSSVRIESSRDGSMQPHRELTEWVGASRRVRQGSGSPSVFIEGERFSAALGPCRQGEAECPVTTGVRPKLPLHGVDETR